jgi:ferredoxin/flavodoxin---NADP+ reductase
MSNEDTATIVTVIGAGPAGIYAARHLALNGVKVALINRDIKPGGLAEYGIYYDKYKMKDGLRKQFRQILTHDQIGYYGNLVVGQHGDLTLDELQKLGFQAVLVTVGAQGTKWLGLPGEDLTGVYHAKDLVYHYNQLPPYGQHQFAIGRRVALIGVGNVMMDLAHWLTHDVHVDEVVAVARRGPAEVKFSKQEMESVGAYLDLAALDDELERSRAVMETIGQSVDAAKAYILAGMAKALPPVSHTRFSFDFLASPVRILGDAQGRVAGLEVEETTLLLQPDGGTKAKNTGVRRVLDVDTVIFCIGDRVDESFGLPVEWNEYIKNPSPLYPVDGLSYEAYDPQQHVPLDGVFVAGWARKASDGLVGVARKDGENGARAVLQYLQAHPASVDPALVQQRFLRRLRMLNHPVVTKADWQRLEEIEQKVAQEKGLEMFRFSSSEEMLAVLGMLPVSLS